MVFIFLFFTSFVISEKIFTQTVIETSGWDEGSYIVFADGNIHICTPDNHLASRSEKINCRYAGYY